MKRTTKENNHLEDTSTSAQEPHNSLNKWATNNPPKEPFQQKMGFFFGAGLETLPVEGNRKWNLLSHHMPYVILLSLHRKTKVFFPETKLNLLKCVKTKPR